MSKSSTIATPLAEKTLPSRIVTSTSTGSLPLGKAPLSSGLSFAASNHKLSTAESLTSYQSPRRNGESIENAGNIQIPPPSARSRIIQFVDAVKSCEWDARYKALVQFTEQIKSPDIVEFILGSKSTVTRLFDIFLGGLMDVHFKVVVGVLEYGHKLFAIIPSDKHVDPIGFANLATLRLYIAMTNIQFKTKQMITEEARNLVDKISQWLPPSISFIDVLAAAAIRQEASIFSKARTEIVQKIMKMVESVEFSETVLSSVAKKLGLLLSDRDDALVQRVYIILQKMSVLIPLQEVVDAISINCRPALLERLNMNSTKSPRPSIGPNTKPGNEMCVEKEQSILLETPASPMHGLTIKGEIISTPSGVIALDSEVSVNKHIRVVLTLPATPINRSKKTNVDFDTPRSMQHQPSDHSDDSQEEAINEHSEEEGEIIEEDVPTKDLTEVPIGYLGI
jgi:hypothetical protein